MYLMGIYKIQQTLHQERVTNLRRQDDLILPILILIISILSR